MAEVLIGLAVVVAGLLFVALVLLTMARTSVARKRRRVAHEVQLAEWRLHQLRQQAIRQMCDEARRHLGR